MAIRYELGNGKTILISLEEWLEMDDLFIQKKIAEDAGIFISDPFTNFDGNNDKQDDVKKVGSQTKVVELHQVEEPILPEEEIEKIQKEFDLEEE